VKTSTLAKDHRIVFGEFAALSVGHMLIFKLLIFLSPCVLISLVFEGMRAVTMLNKCAIVAADC
jgi:hypothetical protein